MWLLKFILLIIFAIIFIQDCKDRKVYGFLYPIMGIIVFIVQLQNVSMYTALVNITFNFSFISLMIACCYLYATLKLKVPLLKDVLGLGDILFFMFIAFSFSMISFFILFIFSLIFTLVLHFIFQHKQTEKTVPLAGYMSLFFGAVYGISFFYEPNFLYAY